MIIFFKMPLDEKYKIKNILFSTAWCLLLVQVLILGSNLPNLPFSLTIPCFLLLCISAIFPFDYKAKEIFIIIFMGILTVLVCYISKYNILIWVFTFIVCSKGIPIKPIFFKSLIIYSCIFTLAVVLSLSGIIPDVTRSNGGTSYLKHALGLGDANTAHAVFLIIITLILSLYYQKLNYIHLVMLIILNTILMTFTICRTSAVIVYFILFATFCEKLLSHRISQKAYKKIILLMIALLALYVIFMTISPIFYDETNNVFLKINHLFTGRFALGKIFFDNYPILPFGNYISEFFAEPQIAYLDNGYSVLLLQFGFIYTILYIGLYFALLVKFYRQNNFAGILVITSVLLYMSMENLMTIIYYNLSYFWFRDFLFKNQKD